MWFAIPIPVQGALLQARSSFCTFYDMVEQQLHRNGKQKDSQKKKRIHGEDFWLETAAAAQQPIKQYSINMVIHNCPRPFSPCTFVHVAPCVCSCVCVACVRRREMGSKKKKSQRSGGGKKNSGEQANKKKQTNEGALFVGTVLKEELGTKYMKYI